MKKLYQLLLFSLVSGTTVFAQASFLDNSFGTNGLVTIPAPPNVYIQDIAIHDDGSSEPKIVCAVRDFYNFRIFRFNSDGSVDAQFGNGGKVEQDTDHDLDNCISIAIQPDGKILALCSKNRKMAIARINDDGTWDNTFGNNGVVEENIAEFESSIPSKILLKPDGKIVAVGEGTITTTPQYTYKLVAMQYNSDGTPDGSFGSNGVVTDYYQDPMVNPQVYAVLQSDGKVVTAFGTSFFSTVVTRYNLDGSRDNSFGTAGFVPEFPDTSHGATIYGLIRQSDDKIVYLIEHDTMQTRRLNTDGSPDSTYGVNGISRDLPQMFNSAFAANSMVVQSNNKLLLCANYLGSTVPGYADGSISQVDENGFIVHGFASNGTVYTDINGLGELFVCMAVQRDNKIVVAGMSYDQSGNFVYTMARYNSNLLGVNEMPETEKIKIYPNPNNGRVEIKHTKAAILTMYNITGQVCGTVTLNASNKYTATITDIPQGQYLLKDAQGRLAGKMLTIK